MAILVVLAAVAAAIGGPKAAAQDGGEGAHPAHIHSGTCAELGDIVEPLEDVAPVTGGEVLGSGGAVPVKVSETEVELPLGEILAAPHAVNIHRSAEEIQVYIACGEIGGRVVDGRLVIGLQEASGSDHVGVAVLTQDDDETEVAVFLFEEGTVLATEGGPAPAAATPEATAAPEETAPAAATVEATVDVITEATAEPEPEVTVEATAEPEETATAAAGAEPPAGAEVAVDIVNFSFVPDPVEINVGDTVTWTNQDGVPHTATAQEQGVLQSGPLVAGASFSQTFEEAGEFAYFCEFHPGMTGTIVVQ